MSKLPDRLWRPPRREDDEAAEEEGIGRILALSDGVFAIALTLLVIAITVPATMGNAGLPKALLGLWPRYLAYLLSFVVIARFWVIHHLAFRLIARYDMAFIWLNLCCSCSWRSCHSLPLSWASMLGHPQRRCCMRPR